MSAYPPYSSSPDPDQPAPGYAAPQPAESIGSWLLTIFVAGIPLVGFIYVLVVAFGGSSSEAKKNWARATLIWMVIGIALAIIIGVFAALSGYGIVNGILYSTGTY